MNKEAKVKSKSVAFYDCECDLIFKETSVDYENGITLVVDQIFKKTLIDYENKNVLVAMSRFFLSLRKSLGQQKSKDYVFAFLCTEYVTC